MNRKTKDRKDKIEHVLKAMRDINGESAAATAWGRLYVELASMSDAEARPPRFHGLLTAIWRAATNES